MQTWYILLARATELIRKPSVLENRIFTWHGKCNTVDLTRYFPSLNSDPMTMGTIANHNPDELVDAITVWTRPSNILR